MWKDLKYLIAYLLPFSAFLALIERGYASWATIYLAFIIIPLFELFFKGSDRNFSKPEEERRNSLKFFDFLLYLNIPLVYGVVIYYFYVINNVELANYEFIGLTACVGTIIGSMGINVAHELGHRREWYHQIMALTLLLPALYMHFYIEHNRGHHKNVGTDEDPASAKFGESLYAFWFRSVIGSYLSAWKLEKMRLQKLGLPILSLKNEMVAFHFIQLAYLLVIGLIFNWTTVGFAVIIAVFGFLLLECVNYIEHYGLRRKKMESGRYENVLPRHSWNSDHELGRIFLYELTRHSDHHYKATRKYQVLRHMDESPQMPLGYPGSILVSLVPPLWFRLINGKVKALNSL